MTHPCAWPKCKEEGTFRAPRNPRDLRELQYFCQPHIKEFNKRWDGLSGFSENEIYKMQDGQATWQRPTWSMGVNPTAPQARIEKNFASADDLFGFFKNRVAHENTRQTSVPALHLPPDVKEACVIFNIEQPLTEDILKKRYLSLVKQHHPDVNKSPDAPEHIKRINVAFRILCDFAERRGV